MAAWIFLTCSRSTNVFPMRRWFPFLWRSESLCRAPIGLPTFPTDCPSTCLAFNRNPASYLAFLGRISPEKRVDRAIEIARRAGMPLKIAAKIDQADRAYYESTIKPLMNDPGTSNSSAKSANTRKSEFLGNAYAYLFPIDWPEPFGLTMIEAMACGTPSIAFNCGSVPEVMHEGLTGFIVEDMDRGRGRGRENLYHRAHRLPQRISKKDSPPRAWRKNTSISTIHGIPSVDTAVSAADPSLFPHSEEIA